MHDHDDFPGEAGDAARGDQEIEGRPRRQARADRHGSQVGVDVEAVEDVP